ncbi:hypothetical protein [Hymenobacter cellulosilyticus]|uniref:Uncharacterized protein n=1 Tax=Hymenobacter cellulosilyticus TaxID=2932248 RepID=A0A8T9QDJ5_9BACT|nr:hypothetical protein [Hymenobacter cellulosilyticus]UOQ74208.1 hypothetical protein MUN79_10145 [Hymenobacter cellulosilyticus]
MQPTVSTIRAQGETELVASLQPKGRLEASVVHSPLPHLLVSAAGSFRPKLGDSTYAATRQWEAGVGTYWNLGPHWSVTALAGGGHAYVDKSFKPFQLGGYSSPSNTRAATVNCSGRLA